jgi:hypothetical protein
MCIHTYIELTKSPHCALHSVESDGCHPVGGHVYARDEAIPFEEVFDRRPVCPLLEAFYNDFGLVVGPAWRVCGNTLCNGVYGWVWVYVCVRASVCVCVFHCL